MSNYIQRTFFETDDFKITLEELDGNLMAHVAIYRATLSNMKHILKLWQEILVRAYFQGYENIYAYSKDERMSRIFKGSKELGEFEKLGTTYKVWGWDLN